MLNLLITIAFLLLPLPTSASINVNNSRYILANGKFADGEWNDAQKAELNESRSTRPRVDLRTCTLDLQTTIYSGGGK